MIVDGTTIGIPDPATWSPGAPSGCSNRREDVSLRRHLTVSNNNYNPAEMSQSTEQTNISKVNEMVWVGLTTTSVRCISNPQNSSVSDLKWRRQTLKPHPFHQCSKSYVQQADASPAINTTANSSVSLAYFYFYNKNAISRRWKFK
jgi:hypothetical protein